MMTHPPAQRPLETDSELLEPDGTIAFIPPTRRFPEVIRSWRPNLSETTRKARARASRVHPDLRRPGVVSRGLGSSFGVPGGVVGSLDPSVGRESDGSSREPPGGRSALGRLAPPVVVGTSGSRTIDAEPGVDRGPGDEPLATMCGCASSCRERTHQPVAGTRPMSPERDARVT